jgi:two-component system chemotaxis response regulator CheY
MFSTDNGKGWTKFSQYPGNRGSIMKILLVDDSKSAQLKTHEILSKYGECDQAYNGLEALDYFTSSILKQAPYDLVVMDIVMPEMDGFQASKEIMAFEERENIPEDKRTKIVMLTSKAEPKHMIKAQLEIGVTTYLTKPFDEETLIETLDNLGLLDTTAE